MKDKIIIVAGPTGVGKTKYSIDIAKKFNGEIISCDSFQIYKYMDIGTAKITENEMDGVIHHNLDIIEPDQDYNTSLFKERTLEIISEVLNRNKTPILVGGTGLYIHSIIHDLDFSGGKPNYELRNKLEKEINENGLDNLYKNLESVDKDISQYVNPSNPHRVIRAYEMYITTSQKPSELLKKFRSPKTKFNYLYIIINDERNKLYEKINQRVDMMFDEGLKEEVDNLINRGYTFDLKSFKAIGYKEFKDYYSSNYKIEEVKEKIKQHTRNYAKRQITWLKRVEEGIWLNKYDFSSEITYKFHIENIVKEFLENNE